MRNSHSEVIIYLKFPLSNNSREQFGALSIQHFFCKERPSFDKGVKRSLHPVACHKGSWSPLRSQKVHIRATRVIPMHVHKCQETVIMGSPAFFPVQPECFQLPNGCTPGTEAGGPSRYLIYSHSVLTNLINANADLMWYLFHPPL